jgi:hypothetical protein
VDDVTHDLENRPIEGALQPLCMHWPLSQKLSAWISLMLFAIDDRGIPGRHALRFVLKGALVYIQCHASADPRILHPHHA